MFISKYLKGLLFISLLSVFTSCEKLIETTPVGAINVNDAYKNEKNIEASLNGIYFKMQQTASLYNGLYCSTYALLADEAIIGSATAANDLEFASNNIRTDNLTAAALWNNSYTVIYQCNSLLEGVENNSNLSLDRKNQFLGEAKFLRAFSYFMLIQYYGDVPLSTSSDYRVNNTLGREKREVIDNFIVEELEEAEKLLPDGYQLYGGVRTRVSKQAARALASRQYLYLKNWKKAEEMSTLLINDQNFTLPNDFNDVLKSNSQESIFEIWFNGNYSTRNFTATYLVPNLGISNPAVPKILPSSKLVNAFELNASTNTMDKRKLAFIRTQENSVPRYDYFFKYRDFATGIDQFKILRLAEQYLIRAEARAQLGLSSSNDDINKIRIRAGLNMTSASNKEERLIAIAKERFVELCFEGHRWPDLLRTEKADEVLSVLKPSTWQKTDKLLPIPGSELGKNPNLNPQNPGYQNN